MLVPARCIRCDLDQARPRPCDVLVKNRMPDVKVVVTRYDSVSLCVNVFPNPRTSEIASLGQVAVFHSSWYVVFAYESRIFGIDQL